MTTAAPIEFIDIIDFTPVKFINPTRPTAEFSRRLYRHNTHTDRCVMCVNSSTVLSAANGKRKNPTVNSCPQDAPERPTRRCNHGKGKRRPERAERVQANVDGMAAIVDGAGAIPPNMGVGTPEGVRPVSRPWAEVPLGNRVTLFRPPRPIPDGGTDATATRRSEPCRRNTPQQSTRRRGRLAVRLASERP